MKGIQRLKNFMEKLKVLNTLKENIGKLKYRTILLLKHPPPKTCKSTHVGMSKIRIIEFGSILVEL